MFQKILSYLPTSTILTLIPLLFQPVLDYIQKKSDTPEGELLLKRSAYISKKIIEAAFTVYKLCWMRYNKQDYDLDTSGDLARILGWTIETTRDIDTKVAEIGTILTNGNYLNAFDSIDDVKNNFIICRDAIHTIDSLKQENENLKSRYENLDNEYHWWQHYESPFKEGFVLIKKNGLFGLVKIYKNLYFNNVI
jgi:hypothetical protein